MIRILHIMSPGSGNFGGIEAYLYQYYKYLDHDKISFDFAFLGKNTMSGCINDPLFHDSKMIELNILDSQNNRIRQWVNLYFAVRKLVEDKTYNIVEVHTGSPFIQTVCAFAVGRNIKKIAHSHSASMENKNKFLRDLIVIVCKKIICNEYDYLFACSDVAGMSLFGKNVLTNNKFCKIPNAIEASEYKYNIDERKCIREKYNLEKNTVLIGHVARLSEEKNQLFLIDVFNEYLKINPNSKLWIVGEGPMRETIELKIKKMNLKEKIVLLGERKDVPKLLQAMDVFLVPSFCEGLCISAIESQAAGVPTIVSDGVPEECKITSLFTRISLSKSCFEWASLIKESIREKEDTFDEIIRSGYDIHNNVQLLQNKYEAL